MTNEDIIRELKNVEKEYENKPTPTFSINISRMARSCRQHIEQLAEENAQMKVQIEKMKNCVNCKHRPKQPTNKLCQYADICSIDYDKWEMKE